MSTREYEVLRRYRQGRIVRSEDRHILRRLESTGIMHLGYGVEEGAEQDGEMDEEIAATFPTAGLTEFGKKYYQREVIRRIPILRGLHGLVHSV